MISSDLGLMGATSPASFSRVQRCCKCEIEYLENEWGDSKKDFSYDITALGAVDNNYHHILSLVYDCLKANNTAVFCHHDIAREGSVPVVICRGSSLSHPSYSLFDFFTTIWRNQKTIDVDDQIRLQTILGPKWNANDPLINLLTLTDDEWLNFLKNPQEALHIFGDFTTLEISDLQLRQFPAFKNLTSNQLFDIISTTSNSEWSTAFPRWGIIQPRKNKRVAGWRFTGYCYEIEDLYRLNENITFYRIFNFEIRSNRKTGKDGRVYERHYRFFFNTGPGILSIWNAISGGVQNMNPAFYELEPHPQLLYRVLLTLKNFSAYRSETDKLVFRIGSRDIKKRLIYTDFSFDGPVIVACLLKLEEAGLITRRDRTMEFPFCPFYFNQFRVKRRGRPKTRVNHYIITNDIDTG